MRFLLRSSLAIGILFSACCSSQHQTTLAARCSANSFPIAEVTFKTITWAINEEESNEGAFCYIEGETERRVSEFDEQSYAIGFEMRLPLDWNQRFLFQGNGGTDGRIVPATGASANHSVSALQQGFAVISTDAGHQSTSLLGGASFGIDPLARVNYGYRANQVLTPIAKNIIEHFYGQGPRYSYFKGCSNGGRHVMVAASRLADEYDGFLAGNPGFNLPKAAVQHAWDIQTLSALNTDISQSLSSETMDVLATAIVHACDQLDGLKDGMVHATHECQQVFELDSLQCGAEKEGVCLDRQVIAVIDKLFSGPTNSKGEDLYSAWVYDAGVNGADWRRWKITSPIANLPMIASLGAGSLATIFTTPPTPLEPAPRNFLSYLRNFDFDKDALKIYTTTEHYRESAVAFMTPPDAEHLLNLKTQNGKLIVYHGASDGVFSAQDTMNWYQTLNANHNGKAEQFAKLYVVPGMNHCAGGPATDQFDLLSALVAWVEEGDEPRAITATVNPANPELPRDWSKDRSRPLCPFPQIAFYRQGNDQQANKEQAQSFRCQYPYN